MNVELEKSMESARESIERRTGTYFTSHKAFDSAMDFTYRFLYDTFGDTDFTPIFSSQEKVIVFHKNGKKRFKSHEKTNNSASVRISIEIINDTALTVDVESGAVYDVNSLAEQFTNEEDKENFLKNANGTKSILCTYYNHKVYDNFGIEMHDSFYDDMFFLREPMSRVLVSGQVVTPLRNPSLSEKGYRLPEKHNSPEYKSVNRNYDNLSLAYVTLVEPNSKKSSKEIFVVDSVKHPERLRLAETPVARWDDKKLEYEITKDASGEYKDLAELNAKSKESFNTNLEECKTREESPEIYKLLKSINGIEYPKYSK